ncbi:TonB-dependent receptor [Bacteroides sp. UBA939]|uniref:TonB-dependent receptor n=1 Tax=Bacteroides sp. UBA939 TaxID=1946092 RepID=UPI0025C12A0F|nr:TonB-dependent receptor [Bacteroides sp. UBA939]
MKRIVIAILLSGMVQGAFAQQVEIKGTVRNATNQEAVEFANIVLQTIDSTFVTGVSTNQEGYFALNKIDAGDYRLVLSSIGYQTQYITLNGVKQNTNLGNILLEDAAIALEDVTISGSNQISRSDRKLVFPSERQMKVSTNGVNLLQELMLPRILVNPMNNEIGISGGGELQLRINGVKADINEIKTLRPSDIIRIEYHDNPGLRYGNAEIVLDYIVRRPDTGGSFGTDLSQGVNAMWGNHNVFGKVNHKKSEFGVSYFMGVRDFYGGYRDNEEDFHLADGTHLRRVEQGDPDRIMLFMHNMNASYNYQASENSLFSATFHMYTNNWPHGDYKGTLYNVNDRTDMVNMIDRTKSSLTRPSLDLYYQYNLKNKQTLVFNLVGTYNREKSHRIYQESLDNEVLTDINNDVLGDKYSLIGEVIYEKQFSKGNALSFGLQHTQSYANNEYRNGHNYDTRMRQGNTYMFGEYHGKANKLDYRFGLGLTRFYYSQSGKDGHSQKYNVNPKIVLHYTFSDRSFLRWKAEGFNATPSLSDLSAIEQTVDSFQIRRGNPNLESYLCYRTELTYEWKKGIFYSNLYGSYDYRPNAIMDEKYQEGNKIVQTWDNQKDWQKLSGRLMLRVGPLWNMLQVSFTGGVNHYMSHGNKYSHTYTNWYYEGQASFNYKRFSLFWQMNTNWNNFWGETLTGGENIQMLGVYYKYKDLRIGAGAFNLFTDNYKVENENWNRYASYKTKMYIKESSRMFLVNLSYNFSFGRKFKNIQKMVNNSDNDSGVMSTGK